VSADGDDLEPIDLASEPAADPAAGLAPPPRPPRRRPIAVVVVIVLVLAAGSLVGTALVSARDRRARRAETIVLPTETITPPSAPRSSSVLTSNPDAEFIAQMGVVSPGVGWALNGYALYRTVDDTAHWTDITPPGVPDPIAHIDALDFIDADHAWLAVELDNRPLTIDRTTDGGHSWQAFRPNFCGSASALRPQPCGYPASIDFVDRARGWTVFSSSETTRTLLATRDGGVTWTVAGPTPFVGRLHFTDPSTGWGVNRRGALYRTTDGGHTWRVVTMPTSAGDASDEFAVGAPQFFGRSGVVAARLTLSPWRPPTLTVDASGDGGRTWIARAAPADPTVDVANGADYRFSAASPSDWAVLFGTHVSVTHDAGRHWSTLVPTTGPLGEIDLASRTSAWLLAPAATCSAALDTCANLLLHTRDGGRTWYPGSPTIGITAGRLP